MLIKALIEINIPDELAGKEIEKYIKDTCKIASLEHWIVVRE